MALMGAQRFPDMKKLILILTAALLLCDLARAQKVIAVFTITNTPTITDSITISGQVFTWTNGTPIGANSILITNTPGGDATNFFNVAGLVLPLTSSVQLTNTSSNVITMSGTALTTNYTAGWCTVVLTTNSTGSFTNVIVPGDHYGSAVRISVAGKLVSDINTYSATSLDQAAPISSQLVGTNNNQSIGGAKLFVGTINGTVGSLTNGAWTNATIGNGINLGNPFRSPGTGTGSEQFGLGASATENQATAFGDVAQATAASAAAYGNAAQAIGVNSSALGVDSFAGSDGALAVGGDAEATKTNSTALGFGAFAANNYATAIGTSASTFFDHQIMLGTSSEYVQFPGGVLFTGPETNATLAGTNQVTGQLAFTQTNNTTLANLNNVVDPLSKTYIKVSGPVLAFSIDTIQRGVDGRIIVIQNSTGQIMTIKNESGFGSAADRIQTGTGADISDANNPGVASFIYDSAASRWILTSYH